MLLKNDSIYTQSRVGVASFDGNTGLDAECMWGERKFFLFLEKIWLKDVLKGR